MSWLIHLLIWLTIAAGRCAAPPVSQPETEPAPTTSVAESTPELAAPAPTTTTTTIPRFNPVGPYSTPYGVCYVTVEEALWYGAHEDATCEECTVLQGGAQVIVVAPGTALGNIGCVETGPRLPYISAYGPCWASVEDALAAGEQEDSTCVTAHNPETFETLTVPLWWIEAPWVRWTP
jgi:hypothetical protein